MPPNCCYNVAGLALTGSNTRPLPPPVQETERSYVANMRTLLDVFLDGRGAGGAPGVSAAAATLARLRSDVAAILGVNEAGLLPALERAMAGPDAAAGATGAVADVFASAAGGIVGAYERFVSGYDEVMKAVQSLGAKRKFSTSVESLATANAARCRGLGMHDFLIMPVQRVPRYVLLLSALRKETPESSPDRAK